MSRRLTAVLGIGGLFACTPIPAAEGATVTAKIEGSYDDGTQIGFVRFVAGAGEANRLRIFETTRYLVFRDSAAPVNARGECDRISRHAARCPAGIVGHRVSALVVRLRDGNDRAVSRAEFLVVRGGPGRDVIVGRRVSARSAGGSNIFFGGPGDDTLLGGTEADDLHAGPGRDSVRGGPGDDDLFDDQAFQPSAGDTFDGGPGLDTVDYSRRIGGLHIDLARQPALRNAEPDRVVRVERVTGGRGDDQLAGDSGHNLLDGGPGNDLLLGRGGHDALITGAGDNMAVGGPGRDYLDGDLGRNTLIGGPGSDTMQTINTYARLPPPGRDKPDTLYCGAGRNEEIRSAPWDRAIGCERLVGWEIALEVVAPPRVVGRKVRFRVRCDSPFGDACRGTAKLTTPRGQLVGRTRFHVPDTVNRARRLAVPLTPRGRAVIRQARFVRVSFSSAPRMLFDVQGPLVVGYTARLGVRTH